MAEGLREKLIDVLRAHILRQLPKRLSEVDPAILARVTAEMDVAGHIRSRLAEMPLNELEVLIRKVAHREFLGIEMAGAGIGLVIGLVQAGCVALLKRFGLP